MQQACTLVSYSCQTEPAISILRLHLNVASFLVISFMKLRFSVYLKLFYMSFHQVRMMLVKSSPLLYFLAIFAISCCSMFAKQLLLFFQISPLLSSPLFCRWWNCLSPNIIWNMSWWSRTCEELGIITSRPTLHCPLFSVMMPWCSKFMIKWWLTCFWGLYYCYYSFFYIVIL